MKRLIHLLLIMVPAVFLSAMCTKTEPTEEPLDLRLSVTTTKTVKAGTVVKTSFQSGKGPKESDMVVLKGMKTYEYAIHDLTASSFSFTISPDFVTGDYLFCIRRGSTVKEITTVTYTMQADDITPDPDATIYGIIKCDGAGVAGVQVSDGYEVVLTDSKGVYNIKSVKKNNYVYITVPSGHEVASKKNYDSQAAGILPVFWKKLTKSQSVAERVDFDLFKVDNQDNYKVLFFGDMHLAGGKQNDVTQFARFKADLNSFMSSNTGEKIYAFTLGDMTWDLYWYDRSFCFEEYLSLMEDVNSDLQIFHTIGNHDHNMKTSVTESKDAIDWDTAGKYRSVMGPNYYSVNIGRVHYIVVDDIYCYNTTGGTANDRKYDEAVGSDMLNWLKKDLANVSKTTPVVVTMHAPVFNQSGGNAYTQSSNATAFTSCFSDYSSVTFVSGHSHKLWTVDKSNIREHNNGAVCAAWWWAGYYYPDVNVAQDGAPAGYRVMDVKGTSIGSYFKATGHKETEQFRTYDRNSMDMSGLPLASTAEYLIYGNYAGTSSANYVYLNIWDYNSKWQINVTEKETGKTLSCSRITAYDPLYIQTYVAKRYPKETETKNVSFGPHATNHMFRVQASSATSTLEIKVTDDEGRVYTETMIRPKTFSINTYK